MCASLAGCAGTGGDTEAPGGLRFPCDSGSVEWKGTPFFLLTQRQPSVCVCADSVCLRARRSLVHRAAKNLSQLEKLPEFEERRPSPASLVWLSAGDPASHISHLTSHCWPVLARSGIKLGHPVVWEATPSSLPPSSGLKMKMITLRAKHRCTEIPEAKKKANQHFIHSFSCYCCYKTSLSKFMTAV